MFLLWEQVGIDRTTVLQQEFEDKAACVAAATQLKSELQMQFRQSRVAFVCAPVSSHTKPSELLDRFLERGKQ